MLGRTHDLSAFTALNLVLATQTIPKMSVATAAVAIGANFIGGLLPDIDEPSASFWQKLPAGSILGRIVRPLLGSHRLISHSLAGVCIAGWLLHILFQKIGTVLLVDMNIVWWTTMIGYVSHLVVDSFTTEGVPWLFPIPICFGFPPFKKLRMKTGGIMEKSFVFPGLLLLNGYLIYQYYPHYLTIIRSLTR